MSGCSRSPALASSPAPTGCCMVERVDPGGSQAPMMVDASCELRPSVLASCGHERNLRPSVRTSLTLALPSRKKTGVSLFRLAAALSLQAHVTRSNHATDADTDDPRPRSRALRRCDPTPRAPSVPTEPSFGSSRIRLHVRYVRDCAYVYAVAGRRSLPLLLGANDL